IASGLFIRGINCPAWVDDRFSVGGSARRLPYPGYSRMEPFVDLPEDHMGLGTAEGRVPVLGHRCEPVRAVRGFTQEVAVTGLGVLLQQVPQNVVATFFDQGANDGLHPHRSRAEVRGVVCLHTIFEWAI